MRRSALLFKTMKEAPADAQIISHKLLEQAGYLQKVSPGIFTYTPLLWRVIKKLIQIVREEMDAVGMQEVLLPFLQPKELWQKTSRWETYKNEGLLYTLQDRQEHEYCIAPTAEEAATFLVSSFVKSYRELPQAIYQISQKFRDEIRPRFGLMRGKEFIMKDGYSFSVDPEGMEKQYALAKSAYSAIFDRLKLRYVLVEAHGGKISSSGKSEEFQVLADSGEDLVMVCGSYAANVEATLSLPPPFAYSKKPLAKEKLPTPNVFTIEDLSKLTKIPPPQILKTLVYKLGEGHFVAIGIRGDRQINPLKVEAKFGVQDITLASEEEVKRLTGARTGFIGPLSLSLPFYADKSAEPMTNFLCAANVDDLHYNNVNWERDLPRPEFCDFLLAEEGDLCPHIPGGTYHKARGIEVGHIFNLGTRYSEKMGATFQDQEGRQLPFWMGTYGIGIGRTAQACIEQLHDEKGIIWPLCIAPYRITLLAASPKDETLVAACEEIYALLTPFEPLLDDRDERLGFKLKDSDLLGIPYKLIVGKYFLQEGKIEIESRKGDKILLEKEALLPWAREQLDL